MRRRFVIVGACMLLAGSLAGIVLRRASGGLDLEVLDDAELVVAFHQPWSWRHVRTRERVWKYQSHQSFGAALSRVRKEVIPRGWTEHRIKSSHEVYVFRERVGGYSVGLEENYSGECRITVSEPRDTATWIGRVISWAQGYDPRFVPADKVGDAYDSYRAANPFPRLTR